MALQTPVPLAAELPSPAPYRVRKHVMCIRAPTLSDAAALVQRAGQQDRVRRWATTARVLEELGQPPCESLTELARVTEFVDPAEAEGGTQQHALAQLRALVGLTAAVSARIAGGSEDNDLRSLCFELARTCQRTQSRIRNQQLWAAAR
jgi:hypothetical protein